MKQLTGFIPIAALPESTAASAKQQLLETIELLHEEGAATETNLKLLTAIVESILCSKESYTRFLQCGFDAAIEFFDTNSQNLDFGESMSSSHNPRNWDQYKRLEQTRALLQSQFKKRGKIQILHFYAEKEVIKMLVRWNFKLKPCQLQQAKMSQWLITLRKHRNYALREREDWIQY